MVNDSLLPAHCLHLIGEGTNRTASLDVTVSQVTSQEQERKGQSASVCGELTVSVRLLLALQKTAQTEDVFLLHDAH